MIPRYPVRGMGELAQLAGRPALVDAHAQDEVEALIIPPERLRALLIGEAELGERVMRALILRRVGLLETGAGGPVIVGLPQNGDVLRLEGFLRRNGHPYQRLNPETDADAKALIERFHVDPGQLPIVLCPTECVPNPFLLHASRFAIACPTNRSQRHPARLRRERTTHRLFYSSNFLTKVCCRDTC